MPEIMYLDGQANKRAKEIIEKSNVIKFRAAFNNPNNDFNIKTKLNFKVVSYDIYGNMVSQFKDLGPQIFLCQLLDDNLDRLLTIGTTLIEECSFNIDTLIN